MDKSETHVLNQDGVQTVESSKLEVNKSVSTAKDASGLTVHVITTPTGMDAIKTEWDALFDGSPSASPPLRWSWVAEWWKHYGETYGNGGTGLRVLAIRRGSDLIGIFPLYIGLRFVGPASVRHLTPVSAGAAEFEETSVDYLHPLPAAGEEDACAQVIARTLNDRSLLPCDELALPSLSHKSLLIERLKEGLTWGKGVDVRQPAHCFACNMQGGFEEYLGRISAKARSRARNLMRKLPKLGIDFTVATTADEADVYFDQMVELHRKRWHARGKTGSFAPRHEAFHRSVARLGTPSGNVAIGRIALRGAPIALVYGHRAGNSFCSYQQGVDIEIDCGVHSPGTVAYLVLMQYLAERGVTEFDLQKGPNEFKEQFNTHTHPLVNVAVAGRSIRTMTYQSAKWVARVSNKARKVLKGRQPVAQASAPEKSPAATPDA